MKILDRYIIRKYLGTLGFMLILLTVIVIVIDVQAKTPRIEENGYTVGYFLLHFYPFWMIYLIITFMSILVFVSIIFFTSRMANNTEIVSYISSGNSFHRFCRPYFHTAFLLMFLTLSVNHFILPWANAKKNELIIHTFNSSKRKKYTASIPISSQISPTEYVFINNYNRSDQKGSGYLYQKFDKNRKLKYQIIASEIAWDKQQNTFILNKFFSKKINNDFSQVLKEGETMKQNFKFHPNELFPDNLQAENKNTIELIKFINREKRKSNASLNTYLNELHMRTSMPISIFILTLLALSLSSQKKRGGLGINLVIGIALAFIFIFSFEVLKIISSNQSISPFIAMWIPNVIFGILSIYLYRKRANQ